MTAQEDEAVKGLSNTELADRIKALQKMLMVSGMMDENVADYHRYMAEWTARRTAAVLADHLVADVTIEQEIVPASREDIEA